MDIEPGQVAVITGAGSGIGRALCHAFAGRGLKIVAVDIDQAAAEETLRLAPVGAQESWARAVDVTSVPAVESLANDVVRELGRVDIVCNNAGVVVPPRHTWEHSSGDVSWTTDVNFIGVVNGVRAFAPYLITENHGHFVNTSSIAGLLALSGGGNGVYAATKHAVIGLSDTLREELRVVAPQVGVTVLCPGPIPTGIHRAERVRSSKYGQSEPRPRSAFEHGMDVVSTEQVARLVLEAIEHGTYLLPTSVQVADRARQHMLDQAEALQRWSDARQEPV